MFRALARVTVGIDEEVYAALAKDPLEPVIGPLATNAAIGFFGRDPGREEIRYGEPFIGAGGQSVRRVIYARLNGRPMPDFAASLGLARHFFWANTVPYKPVGNKAWSLAVKRRFRPQVIRLLVDDWQGRHLITLGREAFLWFGIDARDDTRERLNAFWAGENRFAASIDVEVTTETGHSRILTLHPLPHPSPLNATWFARFPTLLDARLAALGVGLGTVPTTGSAGQSSWHAGSHSHPTGHLI